MQKLGKISKSNVFLCDFCNRCFACNGLAQNARFIQKVIKNILRENFKPKNIFQGSNLYL